MSRFEISSSQQQQQHRDEQHEDHKPNLSVKQTPKSKSFFSFDVVVSCLLFMTVGPALILLNKYLMSYAGFKYPIMLASLGIVSSAILVHVGVRIGFVTIREETRNLMTMEFFVKKIAILALLQSLTLNFGNRAFYHLSVSLIQMLKAFTPAMTLCLLFLTKQEKFNMYLMFAISLLSIGTVITTLGASDNDHDLLGFVYCASAEATEALKLVLKQKLLQGFQVDQKKVKSREEDQHSEPDPERESFLDKSSDDRNGETIHDKPVTTTTSTAATASAGNKNKVNLTIFEGLYYYTPITFVFMCILAVPLELGDFMKEYAENMILIAENWYLFVCAGLLGFGVNVAAFLVTKVISAAYLKALGAVRSIGLVGVAVVLFSEVVTGTQLIGYSITLIGFALYNYIKSKR